MLDIFPFLKILTNSLKKYNLMQCMLMFAIRYVSDKKTNFAKCLGNTKNARDFAECLDISRNAYISRNADNIYIYIYIYGGAQGKLARGRKNP